MNPLIENWILCCDLRFLAYGINILTFELNKIGWEDINIEKYMS